ncbi:MAG: PLDc N-terminal domain-containing protein [Leeuwenhoekiella sp.]
MLYGLIGPWQIILILVVFLIPLIALIDILTKKFEGNEKILWAVVVILTPLIGTLLYLAIGRKNRIQSL